MCKMENQLASLAVIVQSAILQQQDLQSSVNSRPASVLSSYSANSDASQVTVRTMMPHSPVSVNLHGKLLALLNETSILRTELARVRQMHQVQAVLHKEAIYKTFVKIKEAIDSLPIAVQETQADLLQAERMRYAEEASVINNALKELEFSVEQLRSNVVSRRCDVDLANVESTTGQLGQIGRLLAEHKGKLQVLLNKMKTFMTPKLELERWMKAEQTQLEKLLIRWKQLAGTLATLRKLAMVQYSSNAASSSAAAAATAASGSHLGTATSDLNQYSPQPPGSKHRSILYKPELCLPIREREAESYRASPAQIAPQCPQVYVTCTKDRPSSGSSSSALSDSPFESSQDQDSRQDPVNPSGASLPSGEHGVPGAHVSGSPYNKSCLVRPSSSSSPLTTSRCETPVVRTDVNASAMNFQRLSIRKSPPEPPPRKYLVPADTRLSSQQPNVRKARFSSVDHKPNFVHQPQACSDYVSHTIVPTTSTNDACKMSTTQMTDAGAYEQIDNDSVDVSAASTAAHHACNPQNIATSNYQMKYAKAAAGENRGEYPLQFSLSDPGRIIVNRGDLRPSLQEADSKARGSPKGTRGRTERHTPVQSSESSPSDGSLGKSSPLYTSKVPKPVAQKRTQI